MKKIMASLDVGSDSIKLVVGEMVKNKLNILAVAESPSEGINKGLITDCEELLSPLKEVFDKCEEIIGIPIKQVIVTVPSNDATFVISEGQTKVMNEDQNISGSDIIRALQSSVRGKISDNYELISIIPTKFKLDNGTVVKDPKNMISETLKVKSVIVSAPKKTVYPVLTCLEKLGIDVLDLSFGSIGDYYELKNKDTDNEVGVIINIGHEITTISVFNKGILTNTKVIPVGASSVEKDISYVYKLTQNDSKLIKKKFALASSRTAQASNKMEVTTKEGELITINQYEVSEVVESRIGEILKLAKKQINLLTKKEISYIIFTGGLSEMNDFQFILEEIYGDEVILGRVNEIGVRNNKYSSCVGMIKYYASKAKLKDKDFSIFTIEQQEELSGLHKHISITDNGVLGKLFGYFFDN